MSAEPSDLLPPPGPRRSAAVWLSRLFHPFVVAPVVLVALQSAAGVPLRSALAWTALAFGLLVVPTLAFLLARVRGGRYADLDVSVRADRHALFLVGGGLFALTLLALWRLGAPLPAQRALQAAFAAMLAGALATRFVNKTSLHALSMAGGAAALLTVSLPAGATAVALTLLVGWARVHLTRHTAREVVAGGLVGAGTVAAWLLLTR